jgi:hypothetical protein
MNAGRKVMRMKSSVRLVSQATVFSLLAAFAMLAAAPAASADVLTFDDLAGYFPAVSSPYHGFNFTGWYIDSTCSGQGVATGICTSFPYEPESLPTTIFPQSNVNSISSVGLVPFVFTGAYFTGFRSTEQFDLYLGGSLVAISPVLTVDGSETPALLLSGYSGLVDTVVVTSSRPDFFVMDNFMFQPRGVPEPASFAMTLAGLGLLGLVARRRKQRAA